MFIIIKIKLEFFKNKIIREKKIKLIKKLIKLNFLMNNKNWVIN